METQENAPVTEDEVLPRLRPLQSEPEGYGQSAASFPTSFLRVRVGDEPYKGPDSYQFEDSPLFFGRIQEERELASLFLKGRLCILHAQSGAGKTSLLNARVIPRVEEAGIHTVRMTPQSDPLEAIRVASILQLIPPPECEATAIAETIHANVDLADQPLEAVLDYFDALPSEDPKRRKLLAAFEVQKLWFDPYRYRSGRCTPFFCKLLGGTIDIRSFWRHFGTLFSFDQIGADIGADLWKGATLREIHTLLSSPHARAAHREWVDRLDLPEFGFVQFFRNFWRNWAEHQPGYALCLVIDQFEQIFTLYTDDGRDDPADGLDKPDWRLRPSFFDELRRLFQPLRNTRQVLPISVVLSMRDEYVGQLASIRPLAPDREISRYRLEFLSIGDARRSIRYPAQAFGYDYDDKIYDEIVNALKKEDRYIQPAHIQIVCDKTWQLFGQDLARGSDDDMPKVAYNDFIAKTGGTVAIQQAYFREILEEFDRCDQLEVLDMLSDLLTQSSKRNVVEYGTLVAGPLRHKEKRSDLIAELQAKGIVRKEARMGSQFVEIAHEFLIDPLQAEILKQINTAERMFRFAQRTVGDAFRKNIEGDFEDLKLRAGNLTQSAVVALIDNGHRCNWNKEVLDLMLHAGVQHGLNQEQFSHLFKIYDDFMVEEEAAS